MLKKRQVSITRYIITYLFVPMALLMIILLAGVNVMADMMIRNDVSSHLSWLGRSNSKGVSYVKGRLVPDSEFRYEDEDEHIIFQILNAEGKILLGIDPDGVTAAHRVETQRLQSVEQDSEKYLILDRVSRSLSEEAGELIYLRCLVKKKDIVSKYWYVKWIAYATVPGFLLVILVTGLLLSGKIVKPLEAMAQTASKIGKDREFSRRLEYEGRLSELAILTESSNYMLGRLEGMYETQKRFSSDVAHELRTPITVLMAQCEYAKENVSTKEEFDETIDVISRQTERTNEIIKRLLNLNRLESDRVALELEDADLDEMIRSICEDEELRAQKKVTFHLSLGGARAEADIGLMVILLQNLIGNAVKYSEGEAVVEIFTENRGGMATIRIRDHGCGIRAEDLQHIFTPFYRVEEARNSEGFGLGLPLADRIARVHGGEIRAESKWGEGSTFTVTIGNTINGKGRKE